MTVPKMFTIYLIESESGHVQAISDYTGEGNAVLSLGVEIMNTLAMIQPHTDGYLGISAPLRSDAQH
jgi:hypothetical protein